jgi:hypothetical protein
MVITFSFNRGMMNINGTRIYSFLVIYILIEVLEARCGIIFKFLNKNYLFFIDYNF